VTQAFLLLRRARFSKPIWNRAPGRRWKPQSRLIVNGLTARKRGVASGSKGPIWRNKLMPTRGRMIDRRRASAEPGCRHFQLRRQLPKWGGLKLHNKADRLKSSPSSSLDVDALLRTAKTLIPPRPPFLLPLPPDSPRRSKG